MLKLNDLIPSDAPFFYQAVASRCIPIYLADGLADYCGEIDTLPPPSLVERLVTAVFLDKYGFWRDPYLIIHVPNVGISKTLPYELEDRRFWLHSDSRSVEAYWGNDPMNHRPLRTYEDFLDGKGTLEDECYTAVLEVRYYGKEREVYINDITTETFPKIRKGEEDITKAVAHLLPAFVPA